MSSHTPAPKPISYLTAFKFAAVFAAITALAFTIFLKPWASPQLWLIVGAGFAGIFVVVCVIFSLFVFSENRRGGEDQEFPRLR
ncbi:hypothetical protein LWF01_17620 [Saxibacter everestensis]|uniref:Uncharacterized protein n=1 Tax=Saxibacter everestensis TaxID=2909229 RepID=A0ABY8QSI2_9MICO|nr:hypothetical protein LWF01_17620 [Brevibacteriaceae bacterium ZFBP1038]